MADFGRTDLSYPGTVTVVTPEEMRSYWLHSGEDPKMVAYEALANEFKNAVRYFPREEFHLAENKHVYICRPLT